MTESGGEETLVKLSYVEYDVSHDQLDSFKSYSLSMSYLENMFGEPMVKHTSIYDTVTGKPILFKYLVGVTNYMDEDKTIVNETGFLVVAKQNHNNANCMDCYINDANYIDEYLESANKYGQVGLWYAK